MTPGIVLFIIVSSALIGYWILNLPVFGKLPEGRRLHRVKTLANYKENEIKNLTVTPTKPDNVSYWQIIKALLKGNKNGSPKRPLPHTKPEFDRSDKLKITWFGHSSYLLQVDNINILIDPVFSARTSPFQFIGSRQFLGTDFIRPADLPKLDLILITHDHYDHLDYRSILKLKAETTHFITALGVGAHLEYWHIPSSRITELAWSEAVSPIPGIELIATPARHFSGRAFKRNQTLWTSFVLKTKNHKLYLGGDSGYDKHFAEIGEQYGPFDLAILECGQYNRMWPLIHMFPEEVIKASIALKANVLMPVHWGKYKLALHDWDEPVKRLYENGKALNVRLAIPMLGESFYLEHSLPSRQWWKEV